MNVIIIGGAGFLGNHLVRRLLSMGHRVTVFDQRKPRIIGANVYIPEKGEASWYNPVYFVGGDITNYQQVYWAINRSDTVINLAAVAKFADAQLNPHHAASVNIAGLCNVAQACVENKAAHLIYTSTGSVYSKNALIPINEEEPTNPDSVYGKTKLYGEMILHTYIEKIPITTLRLPHIVGPGKLWGANTFITKMLANERPTIFGDGSNKNDFTYVADIVDAIRLAMEKQITGTFNIGSGKSHSTQEFFEWARRLLDKPHIEPIYSPSRSVDFPVFEYDISRAKQVLGYKPKYNLEETLSNTIAEWAQWL